MQQPLKVESITKKFYDFQAVSDISFSVAAGEVLGIVGPNGAGKTTTIKMILGLLQPDRGSIKLFGKPIQDPAVRQLIGYMPENPSFYSHLTGRELLSFAAELFQLPKKEAKQRADLLLEQVGLTEAAGRQLGTYSKGMLQRICLAQALINKPQLLFLDEPLDGLDPLGRVRMKEMLLEVKQQGTAIVLNSHILSDVEIMSDRIAIMDRGNLLRLEKVSSLIPKGKTLEEVFIDTIEAA
jgi:ABC-2 type transport system ATP-binding protein